ncbi:MAG: hypothetical protein J4N36_05780 [Chloroflexi bacterium]|nr:hypothetical protein [Chloroflexota bacterium]MCI0843258.1 hypothetical protein [Chloroflexota bacterium]
MTLNTAMTRGWTAAAAAAILATVAALAFLGTASAQSVSDLTVGSATVEPGGTVTISVTATVDELGSYRVDVGYDSTLVTATECTSADGVCSIDVVASDTVRINGSNLAGITGDDVQLGTITFLSNGPEGVAALTVDTSTLVLSDTVGDTLTVTPTDGAITIATATPAPSDEPTATPAAPAAPAAVPQTGGAPGASSANSMAWLLAAAGLTVVAGGAWVLARAGREN